MCVPQRAFSQTPTDYVHAKRHTRKGGKRDCLKQAQILILTKKKRIYVWVKSDLGRINKWKGSLNAVIENEMHPACTWTRRYIYILRMGGHLFLKCVSGSERFHQL